MKRVHWRKEEYDVAIFRPTKWGNPFKIGEHGTRKEVIEKYEEYIRNNPELMSALPEIDGKILGCWCLDFQPCHGDVLIKLVNEMHGIFEKKQQEPPVLPKADPLF